MLIIVTSVTRFLAGREQSAPNQSCRISSIHRADENGNHQPYAVRIRTSATSILQAGLFSNPQTPLQPTH
ncbi:MAG: hypothetical protein JXA38_00660 [Methanosarcinaceae archaeon]|nr:hypothetical protein [Methanosarcinaceae archaeon]